MSQDVSNTLQSVMTGATLGGGFFSFIAQYQSEITTIAIATTCMGSICFGVWGKINEARRNKVNERDIKIAMIKALESDGKTKEAQLIRNTMVKGLQE
jgi:hypothetical protein